MNPVTTEDLVGAAVGGSESLPVGVVPELSRSTTPAEIVPLSACTRMATPATSGPNSETRRSTVEWAGTMMPLARGGLRGPRLDQKLIASLAGASAGSPSQVRSEVPPSPFRQADPQGLPGGTRFTSERS